MVIPEHQLHQRLGNSELIVVDLRNEAAYRTAHIPGAVHLPAHALNDPESPRSSVWPVEALRANLEAAGIGDHGLVVGYDDSGLVPSAKLFWVLEYLGRGNVAVLNGGFPAWQLAGLPVEAGGPVTPATPAQLSVSVAEYRRAHRSEVLAALNEPDTVLVDARTADEYAGRSQTAERDGHIPGAVHLNWEEHIVDLMNPTLRPLDELRAVYERQGVTTDKHIITYCRSGARSSHSYFVLRLLGYERVSNYAASWLEWGNEPNCPVVVNNTAR